MKRQQRPLGYRRPILLSKILYLLIVATQSTTTSAFAPRTLQRNCMRNHDTMRVKNRRRVYSLSYMSKEGDDSNSSINKKADDRSISDDDTPKQTTISGE